MKVLLFGATGMVGQGVLRECLLADDVELVETVGRSASGAQNPEVREAVHQDLWRYDGIAQQLAGFDACFFCLGVTSSGMKEADYERVTYGMTLAAGESLSRLNHPLKKRGFGMTVQPRVGANGIDPAATRFYRILILGRGVLR